MEKQALNARVDQMGEILTGLSDRIFDYCELGNQEFKSSAAIMELLENHGFAVEPGVGGLPTAFRAVWEKGSGGPSIGFLCEYDALEGMGHACGHQMQGPVAAGAAIALKEALTAPDFKLVVYGTPAEETTSGKVTMLENGCFQDIDVALMFHANPTTTYDMDSMAMSSFKVTFHGESVHAAIQPENGRSALDALLLSFNALEFMREHVKEDTRMHYTVVDAGGPANVVPAVAVGSFALRSYQRPYLDSVIERFKNIIKGASLMTGTTYEIEEVKRLDNRVPIQKLNELLMENARANDAPCISPPRTKTGSTDFGNVMYKMPGACLRVAFVPVGTSSHTVVFREAGKSEKAHQAIILAAKILAATAADLILNPDNMEEVKREFSEVQKKLA